MKGIYWLFYLLFVLGFGVISCSGDNPIVDSEGNITTNIYLSYLIRFLIQICNYTNII